MATPEGSSVSCAWPLNSSSGLDANTGVRAEKLAEETKMDYDIIKILSVERKLNQRRMQLQCSALAKKFKEESWMFAGGAAL